jgi:hypothetical protein
MVCGGQIINMGYLATAQFFYGQPIEKIDSELLEEIETDLFINDKVSIEYAGHMDNIFEQAIVIGESRQSAIYEFIQVSPILREEWNNMLDKVIDYYKLKTSSPRGWYIGSYYG